MAKKTVKLVFNQQQIELMDNTVAKGIAPDRVMLVRRALKEFAERHGPKPESGSVKQNRL